MLELAIPLRDTFGKSALDELRIWFSELPDNAMWYVVSDYCFEDETKRNDVASFSIILNHDKLEKIKEYINAFAPKDIKSTRAVALGFLQYVNSPVVFNISFVIDRSSKFLKDYATKENMENFLSQFEEYVRLIESSSMFEAGFADSALKRAKDFQKSFNTKSVNIRLSRQVYLVATFASLVFHYLNSVKAPSHIAWVSDRDALIDRCDGFIYDLAYFMFLAEYVRNKTVSGSDEKIFIEKPKFLFPVPPKTGLNEYDELVRIPDYLAGTLADFDIEANSFSREKYYTVHESSLVNSRNHAVIHIYGGGRDIYSRRLVYRG